MDEANADRLLARLSEGNTLFLMHRGADPDCVASAHALREAFGGTVGLTDGCSKTGARLARALGLAADPMPHPRNHAVVVAVDTSSRSQLAAVGGEIQAPCLVDHHAYGDLLEGAPAAAWDATRTSCAEVVLELIERAGRPPAPLVATGLLAGMIADTARFRYANARTFDAAARLVRAHAADVAQAHAALADDEEADDSFSARLAVLTVARRAEVETVGGMLVARSQVSSFDALGATALVRCGADVALVAAERGDRARLSLRASPRALARGLHLGELANAAARSLGWSGGGHEGAAGLSGDPPVAAAASAVAAALRERLERGMGAP